MTSLDQEGNRTGEAPVASAIGQAFVAHDDRPRIVLIAEGDGISSIISVADRLRTRTDGSWRPLVFLGSERAFPFRTRPSSIVVPGMPDGCIACMPLLDHWGIASRLASLAELPGCLGGLVTDLAQLWLQALSPDALSEVEIVSCGPAPMLKATVQLADQYGVPLQSLSREIRDT